MLFTVKQQRGVLMTIAKMFYCFSTSYEYHLLSNRLLFPKCSFFGENVFAESERSGFCQAIASHKSMFAEFGTFCNNFAKYILYQVCSNYPIYRNITRSATENTTQFILFNIFQVLSFRYWKNMPLGECFDGSF